MVMEVSAPPTVTLPTRAPPLLSSTFMAVAGLDLENQLREMVVSEVEVTVSPITVSGRPVAYPSLKTHHNIVVTSLLCAVMCSELLPTVLLAVHVYTPSLCCISPDRINSDLSPLVTTVNLSGSMGMS